MFSWKKDLTRLEVPAGRILKLLQSMSDVQVALPGMPGQMATAYLCAYSGGKGVRVAIAFHLHESHQLAFYLNDEGEVPREKIVGLLKDGIHFAESMGFLLDEVDLQRLDDAARNTRWASLPLSRGVVPPAPRPAPVVTRATPAPPGKNASPVPVAAPPQEPAVIEPPPPTAAEMAEKRARLLESLGRFLASL